MKNVAVLGTGMVGSTIATKMVHLGYNVKMGSRTAANEKAVSWTQANGPVASNGTFDEAARFGEIVFLCTKGDITLDVVKMVKPEHLKGKTLVDISNPLDFSRGMPPSLYSQWTNTNSLGEEVQKAAGSAHVVKTLNIVNCEVMVNPSKTGGEPTMFLAGNDAAAKDTVKEVLGQFGWKDIIDLGDISGARGMEMILPIWLRTWAATKSGYFGFKVVR